jgi:tyrosyl-tRNA synthetase
MKFNFYKNQNVSMDVDKIETFLSRGVENIYPNKDIVKGILLGVKRLKIYLGIDPTGPTLHLGHAIPLKKLKELQDMGHEIILLIGDFTAMIGDPTDKASARKQLTRKEVLKNCKNYKKQIGKIISFKGNNPARFLFNSKWLAKMNFSEVIDLASKVTVDQMLKRDMFEKRATEKKPIFIHEFMYPLMQGYDSVAMKVDGEIGGNDQTFNMLMGRELAKELINKEKFIITSKLLVDNGGKKMGKTEGNMATLNDVPSDMFGKVMSWTDGMIISGFELCTNVSLDEIEKNKKALENGVNPRDIKIVLAKEIVSIYHNKKEAEQAELNFINTFSKGGVPEDVEEIKVLKDEKMADVLLRAGTVDSKGEWRRLVLASGVSNAETEEKITSPDEIVKNITLKVGKRRFVRLVVSD